MFKPFRSEKPAELLCQPGLEYWFKERRTLNDFRRGPLGSHFDRFAGYLKAEGYSCSRATEILGKCCQLNALFVDRGLTRCKELSESLIDSFLDVSLENVRTATSSYSPRANAHACLKSKRQTNRTLRGDLVKYLPGLQVDDGSSMRAMVLHFMLDRRFTFFLSVS